MKIAVAQINTTIGDFDGNADKIFHYIKQAERDGADLVVFPEMAIVSYPPRDLLEMPSFVAKNIEVAEQIARRCNNIAAIVGFVSLNQSKIGKGLFNSAGLFYNGRIEFVQHKALLPTYDVFDETRHFEAGSDHKTYKLKNTKIGITVCEDVWSNVNFGGRRLYRYDPVEMLIKDGAQIIINISASPFHIGKGAIRKNLLTNVALRHHVPIIYANMVGGNDELVFDGRSTVVNNKGKVMHEGEIFREDYFVIDTQKLPAAKESSKVNDVEELYEALILGLGDYVRKCNFKKTVIGLSGGIDSAVVASLAAEALGKENVLGIAMPSPYSSRQSVEDAKALAKNLDINFDVIPINEIYTSYLNTLKLTNSVTLTEENIQARIRGNILMAISNKSGAMVLSTGNKSELAVGYCTLYGDMAGGLAVISDVPKVLVYKLADFINRKKEIIPTSTITKAPSAELRPHQKDSDTLPPYDTLDQILKFYIEEHLAEDAIIKKGFDKDVVRDVLKRIDRNEYKRRQAAPGLKVTSKAFGAGRRCPIAWKY